MRKLFVTLTTVLVFLLHASAQDRTVTGTVTDEKGIALEGVSVASPDTKFGTQTDKQGNYSIKLPKSIKSIVFSSVNFESVTKTIKQGALNVKLKAAAQDLTEVVMVGYGTQKKKAFTGSASKVDTKEFAQLITPSIDKELAGRATGVNVTNSSGIINAPARIRIRGANSISQLRDPLVIVDGVPITTGNLAIIGNSNAIGDINPNDIESIDILKDGSSTAIYGSRGAGGIIQITTKKGSRGKSVVNYDATFAFSSPTARFDLLNAQQFVTIANEKLTNSGALPQARMDANGTNSDWQGNVFIKNAAASSHNLSLSGGTNKSTYFMSLNYSKSDGTIRTNTNEAYRLRMNIDHEANKLMKFGNSLSISKQLDYDQNNSTNGLSGAIVASIRALPNVAIYDATNVTGYNLLKDPSYPSATSVRPNLNALGQGNNLRSIDDNYTNIAYVLDKNRNSSDKYRFIDMAYMELSLFKGFKFRSQVSGDYFTDNSIQILDPGHGDGYATGSILQAQQNILSTDIQNYINYNLSIRNHNVYVTFGHELGQTTARYFQAQGTNVSDVFYIKENIITNSTATPSIAGSYVKSAIESVFGRLNYDFKGKYFVQGSLRQDGISALAADKRYHTFPGVSAGWRPVSEEFWKKNKFLSKHITDLKIKASYAEVGNPIGGFPYLNTYSSSPYGNLGGISASSIGNTDLVWENSKKYDVGVELGLGKRINISFDWYKNYVDGNILSVPTPYSAGIPGNSISKNVGVIKNKGIELAISADVVRNKNFTWNVYANYSTTDTKIISLYTSGNAPVNEIFPSNYNINRVGESFNALYGYRFAGVNAGNGNPVYYNAAGLLVQRNVATGGYNYANSLTDPTLGAATSLTTADKVILGNVVPTYYGSFTNRFNYKNFGLEIMFRYSGGNKIMNITRQEVLLNQKFANGGVELLNRWTTPGQVTDVPKLYYGNDAIINQNGEATSRFVEDGSFLRLQNIVFSYNVNKKLLDKTKDFIKSVRVYVQAQNVAVWTKYRGIDPEAYTEQGQDNNVSPLVRTISVGFNVGF